MTKVAHKILRHVLFYEPAARNSDGGDIPLQDPVFPGDLKSCSLYNSQNTPPDSSAP